MALEVDRLAVAQRDVEPPPLPDERDGHPLAVQVGEVAVYGFTASGIHVPTLWCPACWAAAFQRRLCVMVARTW